MAEAKIMDTVPLIPCLLLTVLSLSVIVAGKPELTLQPGDVKGKKVDEAAKPELTLQPGGNLRQGATLTITCETRNYELFDFIRIERVGEGRNARRGEIITNNIFDQEHQDSGRYTLEESILDKDSGVAKIKIRIDNIQGRDGGKLECAHQPKGQTASEEISIEVPPKEVKLMYLDENGEKVAAVNGGVLRMEYGRESGLYCHVEVEGQTTAPKIDLLMDNKDAKRQFKTNHYTDDGVAPSGFSNKKYVADMQFVSAKPDVNFDGKKLKCRAKLGNFPPVETEAQIEVVYAPQMKCELRTFVKLGAKDAKIECTGKMNPPPKVSRWTFGKLSNRTVLESGEENEEYSTKMEKLGKNEYRFTLTIDDEVTQEHLQSYDLVVTNDIGRVEKSIGLHEEEATTANIPSKNSDDDKNSGGPVWEEAQAAAGRGSALRMLFTTVSIVALAAAILMT